MNEATDKAPSAAKAKRGVMESIKTDFEQGRVVWTAQTGEILTADIKEIHENCRQQTLVNGMKQKIGDAMSGAATPSEAMAKMRQCWEGLKVGQWSQRVERASILSEAVARIRGIPADQARKDVAALSDDKRKKLEKLPEVRKVVAEIQLERAEEAAQDAPEMDMEDLFG